MSVQAPMCRIMWYDYDYDWLSFKFQEALFLWTAFASKQDSINLIGEKNNKTK